VGEEILVSLIEIGEVTLDSSMGNVPFRSSGAMSGQNTRNPGSVQHRFKFLSAALGQKRTSHQLRIMSALPPKADIV
jgi:hypothetical protein